MEQIKPKNVAYGARVRWHDGQLELAEQGRIRVPDADQLEFEDVGAGNPEVLLATAHVTCYASALHSLLDAENAVPDDFRVTSKVVLTLGDDGTWKVSQVAVAVECRELDAEQLQQIATSAEDVCPISGALADPLPVRVSVQ